MGKLGVNLKKQQRQPEESTVARFVVFLWPS